MSASPFIALEQRTTCAARVACLPPLSYARSLVPWPPHRG